ncbi:spore protease YyaC [Paenibacillus sp. OAS669]|uniref:spore protease YyaC n=1 Tax=Paenibacillus sp. OAS669 TaxID=2663821 RepID=UPI00178A5C3E|nr:spore protease YyaC [Paenibacillus sp. OAS669]MBE1446587.1 putative sporulation protein YyaC [Paenibacillus sp. OAS669]
MNGNGEAIPVLRKKVKGQELAEFLLSIREPELDAGEVLFLCIGTDRSTGDALGPLVGTMLTEAGYPHVMGTLEAPVDASNMIERLADIPPGCKVVAIDACLGQHASVASYQVSNQPMEPGKSLGKQLPAVGDYSIAGIVNVDGGQKYSTLQSTSLHRVMVMAKEIVAAIRVAFPVDSVSIKTCQEGER